MKQKAERHKLLSAEGMLAKVAANVNGPIF